MPLGTIDRKAPPFFKNGLSGTTQLAIYLVMSVVLMVGDARFHMSDPVRKVFSVLLSPLQWGMLQPVQLARDSASYVESISAAQEEVRTLRQQTVDLAQRAALGDYLQSENARLRALLELKERTATKSQAAEVLYDTPDPYTRRIVIDRGSSSGIVLGAPVLDASGVLGQVTQVYALTSEVTLLVDRDQAIPILNVRTGARGVAYGDPVVSHGGGMELRYVPLHTDVQAGDELTTSGVDGVYPPGVPVAKVVAVEHPADSAFAKVYCMPFAQMLGPRHVMVLEPVSDALAVPSKPSAPPSAAKAKNPATVVRP